MEEERDTTMMMISSTPETAVNQTLPQEPINTVTCPTWKLYENPFYNPHSHLSHHHVQTHEAHKRFQSIQHLTLFRSVMESELDYFRSQISELKTELEFERKARKKVEQMNRKLAKELAEERRGREALERVCGELAKELSSDKIGIDKLRREMEEERKMMRMAEVLREERVQMKLAEARMYLEEKMSELEINSRGKQKDKDDARVGINNPSGKSGRSVLDDCEIEDDGHCHDGYVSSEPKRLVLREKPILSLDNVDGLVPNRHRSLLHDGFEAKNPSKLVLREKRCDVNDCRILSMAIHRRPSPEPENPHIKRGIKGFVEFPRVVKAIGSKNRHWGTKLECQKAQIRILLKQKSPLRSNNLIWS